MTYIRKNRREERQLYREMYRDKYNAQIRAWKAKNKEKVRVWMRNARYRNKGAVGSFTLEQWENVKSIFGYKCAKCLKPDSESKLTIDHKIPIVLGGSNFIDNIQPLCKSCNSRKKATIWFASCPL